MESVIQKIASSALHFVALHTRFESPIRKSLIVSLTVNGQALDVLSHLSPSYKEIKLDDVVTPRWCNAAALF